MHCIETLNSLPSKVVTTFSDHIKSAQLSKQKDSLLFRDKFYLQKLGEMRSFFKVKVLSDFHFGDFWRKWLQRHLIGKQH